MLDRRLETLRRILPDDARAEADTALVEALAQEAGLFRVKMRPQPVEEDGSLGLVVLDLEAEGRFVEIGRFFDQLATSHRLVDVARLDLTSAIETIHFSALLRLPYRPGGSPLPAPPDDVGRSTGSVPRPMLEAFARDQALALDKSRIIASWRRQRRNPRLFLSELGAVTRDRPVVIGYASLGEEFLVRGLTVGEGPVRALQTRFEGGFFRVSEFLMARHAGCVRFEVRGHSPVAGPEAALPLPSDDPFIQDDAPCRVDRDSGARIRVRAGSRGRGAGSGPLSVQLHDVDLADVFHVLHRLTGQAFVVDQNVVGRVSVDLGRVRLDEALEAVRKAAALDVSRVGRLHHVRLRGSSSSDPPAPQGDGPTASFTLKRADVRELLALMSEADPHLAALGPPGFLGRVSLWARDLPLLDQRAALLAAAGLSERIEEDRRMLVWPGREDPLEPVAAAASSRRLALAPTALTVMEFDAAGVGTVGAGWMAFAYSPRGTLHAFRVGDTLHDGKVAGIHDGLIQLETDDGPLSLRLPRSAR